MNNQKFVNEVNNVLKEAKQLMSNWLKASEANSLYTQHMLNMKMIERMKKKCEDYYLITMAAKLSEFPEVLESLFKQYENLIDKELDKLS